MPWFRCTNCARRTESPVVIGAGDCPHCGGDVVFDLRGGRAADEPPPGPKRRPWPFGRRRRD
jgi:DNA-directed RNA polymerase subunit RPC12/RpoP